MRIKRVLKRFDYFLLATILLAAFFRFYHYSSRWAMAYDQAWFAIIARYALNTFQLPFLGPFASGGPFQTGGEWFWIVMTGTFFGRNYVISPWVFITLLSIFQVFLMYRLGKEMVNRNFGLLVALLTAFSTSQILQSTNLTNQTPISIFSTLLIWSIVRFLKTKKDLYLFIVGISVGLASSIHLQGVLLLPVILIFIVIGKIISPKKIFLIGFGILIPWLPVLYIDSQNGFYNTKNMLGYFTSDQNKASYEVLGRRWLTYLSKYIPYSWSRIIGGTIVIGYLEVILLALFSIREFIHKKLTKEWYLIGFSTILVFGLLRYLRTPLFENYITFLHPFVLLLVGFTILKLIKFNKVLGIILIGCILFFSTKDTFTEIKGSTNLTDMQAKRFAKFLETKYPNDKFTVFDYDYKTANRSLPMVLYLETHGKMADNGRKIGYAEMTPKSAHVLSPFPYVFGEAYGDELFDLNASESSVLIKNKWHNITPHAIYDSVQNWFRQKK